METLRPVDVICQHSADGKVIPLQIHLTDECTQCYKWLFAIENVLEGICEDDERVLEKPIDVKR